MSRFSIYKDAENNKRLLTYQTDRLIPKKMNPSTLEDLHPLTLRVGDVYYYSKFKRCYVVTIQMENGALSHFSFSLLQKMTADFSYEDDAYQFTCVNNMHNFLGEEDSVRQKFPYGPGWGRINDVYFKEYIYIGNIYLDDFPFLRDAIHALPLGGEEREFLLEKDHLLRLFDNSLPFSAILTAKEWLKIKYSDMQGLYMLNGLTKEHTTHTMRSISFVPMTELSLHPKIAITVEKYLEEKDKSSVILVAIEGFHEMLFFDVMGGPWFEKQKGYDAFRYEKGMQLGFNAFGVPSLYLLDDQQEFVIPRKLKEEKMKFPFNRKNISKKGFDVVIYPNYTNEEFVYHIASI